ncbi:hypothetical protein G647_00346 [Cladophialophora carrionii CBS 160.54]|uniref:UBR-type domain-containing protein n=1 Tax=Cladophialophora carrionii CBS 160.54 TaxID=1279043 RepID=V9DPM8_9EURO|nr:uncharacterized protein G647_00346 [Cladophialophora carrionii CBS 160.54]ETI27897.1 hypothetical protein G647_00346 [Cladophialophora carrionii CBS 160.54]
MEAIPENEEVKMSAPQDSQTASEFIDQQLALEADAREVLPYKFDKCTNILGPLRQNVFACLTCSPPPASAAQVYTPAGVCYACSISCHGEHTLVELFSRRDFVCDCGTNRLPSTSPCTLRSDPATGSRGVHSQEPHKGNHYNHNFQNRFCACGEEYDASTEKGTMYQCLGLGTIETGGCGEDWYHPECLMGLPRHWYKEQEPEEGNDTVEKELDDGESEKKDDASHPVPPGFPHEDDFEALLCYKCVESNPWIKKYAGTAGFLHSVSNHGGSLALWAEQWKAMGCSTYAQYRDTMLAGCKTYAEYLAKTKPATAEPAPTDLNATSSLKRKASDDDIDIRSSSPTKRFKDDNATTSHDANVSSGLAQPSSSANGASVADLPAATAQPGEPDSKPQHKHDLLPSSPPAGRFSLFLKADFRDHLCHCPSCYPNLIPHPQLLEDEETYEPSISSDGSSQHHPDGTNGGSSRASLLERGEAALSNIDRVRAIEGVMVYNHLRDKVKEFLKPYAEEGRVVSADDIKAYFEKLRGDSQAIKEARADAGGSDEGEGDNRREQSGY